MNCAQKNCVYALVGLMVCFNGFAVVAKDNIKVEETAIKNKFQWHEHTKLSWDDFKGVVNTTHNESAAATYCSIGFKTKPAEPGGQPVVEVYNTFYTNSSWVRADAKIQSILDHEQGHFDLCELYTRKLRDRLSKFDLSSASVKQELMNAYAEVSKEYEARQQAYEDETTHGTIIKEQRRWEDNITAELSEKAVMSPLAYNTLNGQ